MNIARAVIEILALIFGWIGAIILLTFLLGFGWETYLKWRFRHV
jgi:hypothetical protein